MPSSESREVALPHEVRARRADWRNVVIASLVGGAVFLVFDVVARAIVSPWSTWSTPRHIAALLLGERVLGDSTFDVGIVTLALALNAMFSLVYGMLLTLSVRDLRIFPAIMGGVLLGSGLYLVNYHLMSTFLTSFAALRGTIAFAAHVAFGVTCVVVYAGLHHRREQKRDRVATPGRALHAQ